MIAPWYQSITGGSIYPLQIPDLDGFTRRHFCTVEPLPGVSALCGAVAASISDETQDVQQTCPSCAALVDSIRVIPPDPPVDGGLS